MVYRICLVVSGLIALAGCYTQIRPPEFETDGRVGPGASADTASVVVYKQYVYNYFDPYNWEVAPYFDPYYPGYPSWARRGFRWRNSYWTAAYGPWWRGWMRRILARGRLSAPTFRYRSAEPYPIDLHEPRLRIRHTGLRGGEPASAGTVRKGGGVTKTTRRRRGPAAGAIRPNPKPEKSGTATRTASKPRDSGGGSSSSKKEEEKQEAKQEEKREEKREGQRRRGGMR